MSNRYVIVYYGPDKEDGKRKYRLFERHARESYYVPCRSVPDESVPKKEAQRQMRELTQPPWQVVKDVVADDVGASDFIATLRCGHRKYVDSHRRIMVGDSLRCIDCVRKKRKEGIQ